MLKKFNLLFLSLIIALGFFLRSDNLNTWPRLGATFDEYAWTWQGINLIQKGVPVSWSPHAQYKDKTLTIYQQTNFPIVKPYLEHPPVFGLVAGGFALLNGVSGMYDVHISDIRPLAVLLGLLSIFLIYLLTSEIYDKKTGLLASLLYATIPSVVVGSRLVQNENFFIPVWLLSLFLIVKFLKTKKGLYRNVALVLCGLLILAKVPWIAAAGSIFLIFIYLKRYRDAMLFVLVACVSLLIYLFYGMYYNSSLFFSLWGLQLARYDITFTSIYALFQKPFLADRFMTDGWIYFGWFAFILLLVRDIKKNYIIIFGLLSYFSIFLAGIPDEAGHGWYRYPFYPFLIISIALFIKEYFAKNWLLTFFFLVLVGSTLFDLTWGRKFGFSYLIFRLMIIGFGISLVPQFFPKLRRPAEFVTWCWLVIFILMNTSAVLLYNEQ